MDLNVVDFYSKITGGNIPDQASLFKELFFKDCNGEQVLKNGNINIRLVGPRPDGATNAGSIEKQSDPVHAIIVEDEANIFDEGMKKEWEKRGSVEAELSWSRDKAIEEFFGLTLNSISEGINSRGVDASRQALADKMGYIKIFNPCPSKRFSYKGATVERRDYGRGVEGSEFVNTFLSLENGNNQRCRFSIGKYGFGASSRFDKAHVGGNGYTLIVSISEKDPAKAYFTVVFAKIPSNTSKGMPQYYFLEVNGEIPFVPIFESSKSFMGTKCGSLLVTYNAQFPTGTITRDNVNSRSLRYRLANYFSNNLIPIRLIDVPALTAKDDKKKKYEQTYISGRVVNSNLVRIQDKRNNKSRTTPLEWYNEIDLPFPRIDNSPIWDNKEEEEGIIRIYTILFPHGIDARKQFCEEKYCGSIVLDGLSHKNISKNIIDKAGHSYLSKHLMIIVDVTNTLDCQKSSMFMSNRENQVKSEQGRKLTEIVENYITGIPELKQYNIQYRDHQISNKREVSEKALEKLFNIFSMGAKKGNNPGGGNVGGGVIITEPMERPEHKILPIKDIPEILRFINPYENKPKNIVRDKISSATVETEISPTLGSKIYAQIEDIDGNKIVSCRVSKIDKSRLIVACLGKNIDN